MKSNKHSSPRSIALVSLAAALTTFLSVLCVNSACINKTGASDDGATKCMWCDGSYYAPSGRGCQYQQAIMANVLWSCAKGYQPQYTYYPGTTAPVGANVNIVNIDGLCNGNGTCVAVYYYPAGPLTNMWVYTGYPCPAGE
jgi:hypothetical protein